MELNTLIQCYNDNLQEMTDKINKELSNKKVIKKMFIDFLNRRIGVETTHYVWKRGYCSYDCSGELRRDGYIDLNKTIYEILNDEYTGNSIATYNSGCGLDWETYMESFGQDLFDFAKGILEDTVRTTIKEKLNYDFQDDDEWIEFSENGVYQFDDLCCNTNWTAFFFPSNVDDVIEYIEIEKEFFNITLKQIKEGEY